MVQRATSCNKYITNFPIPGTRKQGRPRKTWAECVKTDVNKCGLAGIDPQVRGAWRASVRTGAANHIEWDTDSTLIQKMDLLTH